MSSFKQALPPSRSGGFFSIERVVALLTPVFSAAAGWLSTIVAHNVPGLTIPRDQLVAVFIGGATIAGGAALKWLHGRQKFTSSVTSVQDVVEAAVRQIQGAGGVPLESIEKTLAAHESNIINTLGNKIGASPSVEELAQEIVKQLVGQKAGPAVSGATVPAS